jgi:DNA-binding transcriptional MerR regulator
MGWYRIKAVSHMTGIRPELLRMWERRYRLFTPHRSGNRYREYNDEDIQLLQYLRQQIDQGRSIGELAAQGHEALLLQLAAASPTPPQTPAHSPSLADALVEAIQGLDLQRLARHLAELTALIPFTTFLTSLLPAVMHRVGEQCAAGNVPFVCIHLATMLVKQRLLAMLQATAPTTPEAPVLLCACPPGESHELGLLSFAYLMQRDGWHVAYLGPNLTPNVLLQGCQRLRPALVALSFTREVATSAMQELLYDIDTTIAPRYSTVVGGQAIASAYDTLHTHHMRLCPTLAEAQQHSRTVPKARRSTPGLVLA